MSFVDDNVPTAEEASASEEAKVSFSSQRERVYAVSLENEKKSVFDSIVTYAVIAYALEHINSINRGTPFFSAVVFCVMSVVIAVNLKAALASIIAVPGPPSLRSASLFETLSRFLLIVLAYSQFLLVQIVTTRTSVYISDGLPRLENLVYPVIAFLLAFVYYRVRSIVDVTKEQK